MADIFDFIKGIFSSAGKSKTAFTHDVLKRSENEKAGYVEWVNSGRKEGALEYLRQQYEIFLKEEQAQNLNFLMLNSASTNGFILNFQENKFSGSGFQHLFDYLKERVLALDYNLYISDIKNHIRKDHIETIERHYLKPAQQRSGNKLHQQFGNITITLVKIDGKPRHIKFVSHPYTDHKYHEAVDHSSLMAHLLKNI